MGKSPEPCISPYVEMNTLYSTHLDTTPLNPIESCRLLLLSPETGCWVAKANGNSGPLP